MTEAEGPEEEMNITMYAGFTRLVMREGIEKAAAYAAGLGFSSVEVFADCMEETKWPFPDVASALKAQEVLKKHGLTVACYSAYVHAWQNEASVQRAMKMVEIAAALGSPYFHHTLLTWHPLPENPPAFEEAVSAAIDAAERIADHAQRFGITCLYEDQGYYVNGVEGFGSFYREIKKRCKNVGVCGDFGNVLFVGEKPEEFLAAYAEDIRHVHVKDYLWKETEQSPGLYWLKVSGKSWLRETMIGHGVVDIRVCMNILKNAGYQGAYALENGHPEPYEAGVAQAMEYLETALKP